MMICDATIYLILQFVKLTICSYAPALQVEVRHHRHTGDRCKASSPHVVMAAHSPPPADGKTLSRALQDQTHQQETQRRASQSTRGGTDLKMNV